MGLVSGIVIYVIWWWIILFTVLPWGVNRSAVMVKGQEEGAPDRPNMKFKLVVTTLISFFLWTITYLIIDADIPFLNELFMG